MHEFYRQLTAPESQDDVRWASLIRLTRLARRQMQALASDYTWHNW